MSIQFLRQIERLNKRLIELGDIIENQVNQSIYAIVELDKKVAKAVIKGDKIVDAAEIETEEECLKILALYQPVADDLRQVVTILKINNDLERIGDHAVIIASEALRIRALTTFEFPPETHPLIEQAKLMLRKSLLAFVEGDMQVADGVLKDGLSVRDRVEMIFADQVEAIKSNPESTEQRLHFLQVVRQVQRIADHATNIAEDVVFQLSGDIIRHQKTYFDK